MRERCEFASDNAAGICPEAWDALQRANHGYTAGYGDDEWTNRACDLIRDFFQSDCEVFFVFNGTAANSLVLASLCHSYHSILCHELAHVETDECGAPEFFSNGTKILLLPGEGGKISPQAVEQAVKRRTDIHYPKPKAVSVTQPTEVGTLYSQVELAALAETARNMGLKIHMDGARFGNAVAALGCPPSALTWEAGIDVLSFGGTKAGMPCGEAVVFFDRDLATEFDYRCKQAGQLASKMRYLAAPWIGMLETGAYLRYAAHANACASRLAHLLSEVPGVTLSYPCTANAVFVNLPETAAETLRSWGWHFYNFIGTGSTRFMCSWATTLEQVQQLAADVRTAMITA